MGAWMLAALVLLSACSSPVTPDVTASDSATSAVPEQQTAELETDTSSPSVAPDLSDDVVFARASAVCQSRGFREDLHQVNVVVSDFTGDGVMDGLASFSCIPNEESEYAGLVYFWTNDTTALVQEGEVLNDLGAILIDDIDVSNDQLSIVAQGWDGPVLADLQWASGRWNLTAFEQASDVPVESEFESDSLPGNEVEACEILIPAPSLYGLDGATAIRILRNIGLDVGTRGSPFVGEPDRISRQSPEAGTPLCPGDRVSFGYQ